MTLERQITLSEERIEKNKAFLEANRNELDEKTIETLQTVINNEITAYVTMVFDRYL